MNNPQDTSNESKRNDNKLPIKNLRKRRAPGPAGLLPELQGVFILNVNKSSGHQSVGQTVSNVANADDEKKRRLEIEDELLSMPLSSQEEKNQYLFKVPWIELTRFLQDDPETSKIMKVVKDISWIHNYARKLIICNAIPFLIVILRATPRYPMKKVEEKVLVVKVFAHSGTIDMALPGSIVKKYQSVLVPGTVLVVKNAGLLNRKRRDVLLEIVENNVIYIASNAKIPESTNKNPSPIKDNNKENDAADFDIVHETSDGFRIIKVSKKPFSYETLIENYRKLTDPKLINDELGEYKREILDDDYDFNSYTYNNPKIESDYVTRYRELIHRSPWKMTQESNIKSNSSSSKKGGAKYSNSYSNFSNNKNSNTDTDITRSLFNVNNSVNKSSEISNTNNNNKETQDIAPSISSGYNIFSEQSSESSNDSNGSVNCNNNNGINNPATEANTERIEDANTELVDIMNDDEELARYMDILESPGDLGTNSLNLETPNQNPVHDTYNNYENTQEQQQDDKLENIKLVGEFPDDEDDAFLADINI